MSVLVFTSFMYKAADAQIKININIGSQPEWGPAGYDRAEYYYMPDIDVYYHVSDRTYTYNEGNRWVTNSSLPSRYRNYDLYKGYKVVINENKPWTRNNNYRVKYAQYKGLNNQRNIHDSRGQQHAVAINRPNERPDLHKDNRDNGGHFDRNERPGRSGNTSGRR